MAIEKLRVLLVEDSSVDAKLLVAELRRSVGLVDFERVEDEDAMRAALRDQPWDVVTRKVCARHQHMVRTTREALTSACESNRCVCTRLAFETRAPFCNCACR